MRKLRKLSGVVVLTLAFGAHCLAGIISTPPEPSESGIISTPPEAPPAPPSTLVVSVVLTLVQIAVP